MEFNETWQWAISKRPLPSLCFFGRIRKTRWPPWPLIRWYIFYFSVGNLTGIKISTSSTKLVFFGPIKKTRWPPWLAETSLTSSLKMLIGIQRNLTGSKFLASSTKFVFLRLIGKTRWPPWPLIGWDVDFSSETTTQNSTKLDREQDRNVLYQVCVFGPIEKKNKMAAMAFDWLRQFRLLLWNCWFEFNETWQEARFH